MGKIDVMYLTYHTETKVHRMTISNVEITTTPINYNFLPAFSSVIKIAKTSEFKLVKINKIG